MSCSFGDCGNCFSKDTTATRAASTLFAATIKRALLERAVFSQVDGANVGTQQTIGELTYFS